MISKTGFVVSEMQLWWEIVFLFHQTEAPFVQQMVYVTVSMMKESYVIAIIAESNNNYELHKVFASLNT